MLSGIYLKCQRFRNLEYYLFAEGLPDDLNPDG